MPNRLEGVPQVYASHADAQEEETGSESESEDDRPLSQILKFAIPVRPRKPEEEKAKLIIVSAF